MARSQHTRIIRKYPNRRLYDTVESRYVTLADIRDLVLQDVRFAVIEKKTDEDITRCILLQVICEQEQNGEPILSAAFLSQVIRAYGHTASAIIAEHLQNELQAFVTLQDAAQREVRDFGYDPVTSKIP